MSSAGKIFEEIDLTELDWADYDDENDLSVSVMVNRFLKLLFTGCLLSTLNYTTLGKTKQYYITLYCTLEYLLYTRFQ